MMVNAEEKNSLLLGKKATTFESLYISESLVPFSYAALKRGSICEALA